ncbi:FtsX-like permease family protein [Pseudoduganella sp. FT93W]|uniref:FtsX-like permease family protein n=1 Tax=Duganella fentianensis TaxID=2692177 RepID=A0A845I3R0_9BURK|nr:FtsX-like permease family protein [Duganella fentianensis]MYN46521.1 FtsX-like permease family protein [Duganella fentianensis]
MNLHPILSALLRNKTGPLLVAIQVALSLAILANALHIVQVRQAVASRPSGLASEADVFSIKVRHLEPRSHQAQLDEQRRETAALRAVAGVQSVAYTTQMPLSRSGNYTSVSLDRKQVTSSAAVTTYYSPDSLIYTWGLQLVEGRDFQPSEVPEVDTNTSKDFPHSVIITRSLGQKLWPNASNYLGNTIYYGVGPNTSELRVVGVVARLQTPGAANTEGAEFSMLLPVRLTGDDASTYTVRTEPGQRERVMQESEAALRKSSVLPVITRLQAVSELRRDRYRADQALAWMLVTVSVLLLLITASGIVGMASLWVTQRRKQIGVRRALGARRSDILRYFITENLLITSAGVVAGVLLALALNQLLVSQLEMPRLPAGYLLAGAALLWALGVAAVYGPAWRAASISPATATRST